MDFGITLITEDELDELFNGLNDSPVFHNLISGTNIKTGCFCLLSHGLDIATTKDQTRLLNCANDILNTIQDCTMFGAFALVYPIDDVSLEGILRLAKAIMVVGYGTKGQYAQNIPESTGIVLERAVMRSLNLRLDVQVIK